MSTEWLLQQNLSIVTSTNISIFNDERPFHRKNIQNGVIAHKEILLRGNKYFSKISAVGETTQATLLALVKCKKIKRMDKFQFDA